uniref:Uncharacterized protein n=1 Tax=Chromera velia CCMP2878 TaxID=1169474 RepID=A0A0G4HAQ8_9ALVE|eukprot:Cvel_25751.t1-p1 / transcript=Cvel_25751.t1 / gene=Cvel_25751 / organism=Chromera_velia_CCMP2878 / gene_product=hypothetical protein / transcript_product=hypothetical protein / location=Cvel_scaffold2965:3440-3718(-) / protein_length=93 / sequence_SO=supercontig / SO=protein_coding / is_pseudo=false
METMRVPHLSFQAISVTLDCHLADQTCLLFPTTGPPDWRKDAEIGRGLMLARGNPEAAGGTGKIRERSGLGRLDGSHVWGQLGSVAALLDLMV